MNQTRTLSQSLASQLPRLVFALCVIQPLLDVLSYWLDAFGLANWPTLVIRFCMLALLIWSGFLLSKRRWIYWTAGALLLILTIGHSWACFLSGYDNPVGDWANLLRIYQFPLSTICFITFLRTNSQTYYALRKGMACSLAIIAAVELLSVLTGTNPYTYTNSSLGILGWFYCTSAQSAILSMLVPISLVWAMERWEHRPAVITLLVVGGLGILFLFGTRLSFLALGATSVGLLLTLLIIDRKQKRNMGILLICTCLFLGCFPLSPMYRNQAKVQENALRKQANIDVLIASGEEDALAQGLSGEAYQLARLSKAYEAYLGGLVHKFGLARVARLYDYTDRVSNLSNHRLLRIRYCKLLLEDSPKLSALFGLELGDLTYEGFIYDAENDLHGIFFLCGGVGLGMMLLFLCYFLVLILRALLRNFRHTFTLQAAGWGIALLTCLAHIYATSGVLRRPNASFYLSITLACIFFLVQECSSSPVSSPVAKAHTQTKGIHIR